METSFKLKRFSADKQDQVEALVSYATMLGLTGSDLVSIGGKMNRMQASAERKRNTEIVAGMHTVSRGHRDIDTDFKMQNALGDWYVFRFTGWYQYGCWDVSNPKTKVMKSHVVTTAYEVGGTGHRRRMKNLVLLDVYNGVFKLDF